MSKIMGVDCSSKSFAFSLWDDGELKKWGEIFFDDMTLDQRMGSANRQMWAVAKIFGPVDKIYYESAVYIQNKQTVISLAMMLGAALSPFVKDGTKSFPTPPIVWQRDMNPALTKAEKKEIADANSERSTSWIKEAYRKEHKRRGIEKVKALHNITVTSDNVSDAILVGGWGVNQ